jgi:hypothetical protein
MSYAICLDQNTPNFNLSNLSPNGFSIYTNIDGFTVPIAQNIPYTSLFPPPIGNCPFVITLPAGTTQIVVIDQCDPNINVAAAIFSPTNMTAGELTIECCYAIIDIPQDPPPAFCETCPLTFDTFPTTNIGILTAGNLTSTCGPVTDYIIGWYLNGDYSAPLLTSGFGSLFTPYQHIHPLTGNSSVPVLAGNWEGIVHDIKINNIIYSSVSGSAGGQLIPFESCFDTVVVEPLQCDNGPFQGIAKYKHQINFNSQAVGTVSAPVSVTYALNPTTKYFAYGFYGFNIADELEIKWKSGDANATTNPSLYTQSIYLEKIKLGGNASNLNIPNISPIIDNVWPKSMTSYGAFKKVLTLTNLETSSNPLAPDLLEITITPNPGSNNTQWEAGFTCLDDFRCGDCDFDGYSASLPAIKQLHLIKSYACPTQKLELQVTGCLGSGDWMDSRDPFNSLNGSLITSYKYIDNSITTPYAPSFALAPLAQCYNLNIFTGLTCAPSNNNTITLTQAAGLIKLEFNNINDYNHYYNNLLLKANQLINLSPAITITPVVCGGLSIPQLLQYYRKFKLYIPLQGPNVDCGDNSSLYIGTFNINDYFNITYTANPASNYWAIDIPQTPITNCYPPTNCDSCTSAVNNFVNEYNQDVANAIPTVFTTNVGAKYVSPFHTTYLGGYNQTLEGTGSKCESIGGYVNSFNWYSTQTMPFIPNPSTPGTWTNLTTLSSYISCSTIPYPNVWNGNLTYYGYTTYYQVKFLNLSSSFNYNFNGGQSTNDFELYSLTGLGATGSASNPNFCPQNPSDIIYSYIGGVPTIYHPTFFVNGTPTLIVDP